MKSLAGPGRAILAVLAMVMSIVVLQPDAEAWPTTQNYYWGNCQALVAGEYQYGEAVGWTYEQFGCTKTRARTTYLSTNYTWQTTPYSYSNGNPSYATSATSALYISNTRGCMRADFDPFHPTNYHFYTWGCGTVYI